MTAANVVASRPWGRPGARHPGFVQPESGGVAAGGIEIGQQIGCGACIRDVLGAAGAAWADKAGGTSGVLWGAILTAMGDELGNTDAPDRARVVRAITAGADALHRLGKCQIGDKTMYDALEPFAEALAENVDEGLTLVDAWHAAARTATVRAVKRPPWCHNWAVPARWPNAASARPMRERRRWR